MANGTVTAIKENGVYLTVSVNIAGAVYFVTVSKDVFDALPTTADKQNYIISTIAGLRQSSRQYEDIYQAFIGTILVIPD